MLEGISIPDDFNTARYWPKIAAHNPYRTSDCIRTRQQLEQANLEDQLFLAELYLRDCIDTILNATLGQDWPVTHFSSPRWRLQVRKWKQAQRFDPGARFIDNLHPRDYELILQGKIRGKTENHEVIRAFKARLGEQYPRVVYLVGEIYNPKNIAHHRYLRPPDEQAYHGLIQELLGVFQH